MPEETDDDVCPGDAVAVALTPGCGGSATVEAEVKSPEPAPAPTAPPPADVGTAHFKGDHLEIDSQILFDTGSDHIDEEHSKTVLTDLVALLRAHPELVHLRIEGHTDTRGSDAHNQDLSERRAAAVAKYIHEHGLPNVKIDSRGYGSSKPLCTDATDACHDKNRRVEFLVVKDELDGAGPDRGCRLHRGRRCRADRGRCQFTVVAGSTVVAGARP